MVLRQWFLKLQGSGNAGFTCQIGCNSSAEAMAVFISSMACDSDVLRADNDDMADPAASSHGEEDASDEVRS